MHIININEVCFALRIGSLFREMGHDVQNRFRELLLSSSQA